MDWQTVVGEEGVEKGAQNTALRGISAEDQGGGGEVT